MTSRACLRSRSECRCVLCRPGGPSGGIPPDPIPNSAVKAPSAHGTAAQAAGESVAARSAKDAHKVNPAVTCVRPLLIPTDRNSGPVVFCRGHTVQLRRLLRGKNRQDLQRAHGRDRHQEQVTVWARCKAGDKMAQNSTADATATKRQSQKLSRHKGCEHENRRVSSGGKTVSSTLADAHFRIFVDPRDAECARGARGAAIVRPANLQKKTRPHGAHWKSAAIAPKGVGASVWPTKPCGLGTSYRSSGRHCAGRRQAASMPRSRQCYTGVKHLLIANRQTSSCLFVADPAWIWQRRRS